MRLTDAIGRYVAYTYDGDHLVSVDQNGRGITRYTYDKKGYISAITDQNNKRYTENIFDSRGRVTGQNYPDKTSCSITYDDIAHCTTFFYPETGRTEKTYHDGRKLVTKIEYQDGTTEEYGYDEWQNCIYEKNRRDAVTRRTFTEDGHKIKEEFANGLAINYAYDGNGNCTKEWDNAGGCTRYRYDENGNLAEKSILCDAKHAHYKTLRYGYRSGKRMPKETVRSIISPHWRIRRIHSLCHASASAHRGMNSAIPMIRSAEGSAPKPYRELRSTATMDCITSAASKTRKEM